VEKSELLRHAREMRENPTEAERRLWFYLRNGYVGARFRFQVALYGYIPDFVCFSHRLIVEVDGSQHCESKDAGRTVHLERKGFRLIRFWDNDVLKQTLAVLEEIRLQLQQRPSFRTGSYHP